MKLLEMFPSDCIQHQKGDVLLVKYPPSKKHDPAYSFFRSVVYHQNQLVCVSPSKSIPYSTFHEKYPIEECCVEEFIEGTMINLWYGDKWNLSTRSILDATCTFESDKTFSEMFDECMEEDPLDLSSEYCYSVVMQHPENIIITPITCKRLYIVGKYRIVDGVVQECELTKHSPKQFHVKSYEEAEALAQTVEGKGLMIKCKGERAKIKRTLYYEREAIKGNSPFRFLYLCMRNTPELVHFLKEFPWYTTEAANIETTILQVIQTLYTSYVTYYIRKQLMPPTFPHKKMLCQIHSIYLNIRPSRITHAIVSTFVNQLHVFQLTTLLRVWRTAHTTPSPPDMIR